jgi:hypothetical protein
MPEGPDTGAGSPLAQKWVMIVGAALGALTLLFFMGLVLLGVDGHGVPCESTYLVNITLSLGAALSAAFLGGNATATGAINLPLFKDNPLAVSLSGGIAVLIIMLAVTSNLFGKTECDFPPISCAEGYQPYAVSRLRFGFCYPRQGWEVDAGPISVDAADIYLRQSSNHDVGMHFHVSLIPPEWAGKPKEYTNEVAKTWSQLDHNVKLGQTFIGGRDVYLFTLRILDHLGRGRPVEVADVFLDGERLLEVYGTWFDDTPTSTIDDLGRVRSSLTFART